MGDKPNKPVFTAEQLAQPAADDDAPTRAMPGDGTAETRPAPGAPEGAAPTAPAPAAAPTAPAAAPTAPAETPVGAAPTAPAPGAAPAAAPTAPAPGATPTPAPEVGAKPRFTSGGGSPDPASASPTPTAPAPAAAANPPAPPTAPAAPPAPPVSSAPTAPVASDPAPQTPATPTGAGASKAPPTRLHGYADPTEAPSDADGAEAEMVDEDGPISMAGREVVGWLVIVKGPGRGAAVPLEVGMNSLGRGPDVTARINFGDTAISRDAHAYVTYDHEKRAFHLSHAGQQNVVRVDDEPVVASNPMTGGELVRIGETTLQFVAFCGADFDWLDE